MRATGRCIALVSQKGGVGKTTLTANLAVAFQHLEFKTLMVELDAQGSLIGMFGLDRFDLHHGLFGALTGQGSLAEGIETNLPEGAHLIPANVWSHEEELLYVEALRQKPLSLREHLDPLRASYDYILLDCPPGLGSVTRAALAACDRYLVPVQAESMNLASLPRLELLAETVRRAHNPQLALDGYVVTMADTRTRHACDVILNLADKYSNAVLETVIPRSIRVAEESEKGCPIVVGGRNTRVGRAFVALSEEILSRHARHRDVNEDDEDLDSDADDVEDPGTLPAEFTDAEDEVVRVGANGSSSHAAGEGDLDADWSELEEFRRD